MSSVGNSKLRLLVIGGKIQTVLIKELRALGVQYDSVSLYASIAHWEETIKKVAKIKYSAIILNLTELTMLIATNPSYSKVFDQLLESISLRPHVVIVYEDSTKYKYNVFHTDYYVKYLFYQEKSTAESYDHYHAGDKLLVWLYKYLFAGALIKHRESIKHSLALILLEYLETLEPVSKILNSEEWFLLIDSLALEWGEIAIKKEFSEKEIAESIDTINNFLASEQITQNRVKINQLETSKSIGINNLLYSDGVDVGTDTFIELLSEKEKDDQEYEDIRDQLMRHYNEYRWANADVTLFDTNDIRLDLENIDGVLKGNRSIIGFHSFEDTLFHWPGDFDLSKVVSGDLSNVLYLKSKHVLRKEKKSAPAKLKPYLFTPFYFKKILLSNAEIKETIKKMNTIVSRLTNSEINYYPYRRNDEIPFAIRELVSSVEKSTLFRKYVYKDEIWSQEFEKLIKLFQDYVYRIRNINLGFEEEKTSIGTVYVLSVRTDEISSETFDELVHEFKKIIDAGPEMTEELIKTISDSKLSEYQKRQLVSYYQTECKRMVLDIRHKIEQRRLELKQRIEILVSESTEKPDACLIQSIEQMTSVKPSEIVFPVNNQFVIYTNTLTGNVYTNTQDKEIIEVLREYCGSNIALFEELQDDLKILKDIEINNETRKKSQTKLKKVVGKMAEGIGKVGANLLTEYLKTLMFPK